MNFHAVSGVVADPQNAIPKTDHRNDARRIALILMVAFWVLASLLTQVGELFFDKPVDWAPILLFEAIFTTLGLAISSLIFLVLERFQTRKKSYLVVGLAFGSVLAGYVHIEIAGYLLAFAIPLEPTLPVQRAYAQILWSQFYIAWSAVCLALLLSARVKTERWLRANADAVAHRARLLALRYQLNPHFLFNALNSVAALILDGKDEVAERMVRRLSAFLRRGLGDSPFEEITLKQEIDHQFDYLAIEAERFAERLNVQIALPKDLDDTLVPSFILQPLVENAIKHGVSMTSRPVTILLAATSRGDRVEVSVIEDSMMHRAGRKTKANVGLTNVRQRLLEFYGQQASFWSGPIDGEGYCSKITVPTKRRAGKSDIDMAEVCR